MSNRSRTRLLFTLAACMAAAVVALTGLWTGPLSATQTVDVPPPPSERIDVITVEQPNAEGGRVWGTGRNRKKNVILMIGDGMGFEQLKAASVFAWGADGKLTMQKLPFRGSMTTHPAGKEGTVTDSAAAGTALACGVKVHNGVLSMRKPGNDKPVETLLEALHEKGYRTGLVSTTHLTHATPASFASHVPSRNKYDDIGRQMITCGKVDVMLGGGGRGMDPDLAAEKSYKVVTDRTGLANAVADRDARVVGVFGQGHMPYEYEYMMRIDNGYDTLPHLSEMAAASIALLEGRGNGFFLMVEGGRIDHAGHANDLRANIMETLEFDSAVREVLAWAKDREDTLVIVTADHETGGLKVTQPQGRGTWPKVTWDSKHHSGVAVPVYAWGMGAKLFEGKLDNTDIRGRITRALAGEGQDPSADKPKKTGDKAEAYTP